ncbi:MAG: CYTH domain-containing protein [Patescibacteria group bacterium]
MEIEIEKKFLLTDEEIARLIDGAEDHGEIMQTDTYYDTNEYSLTKKDWWLRKRNDGFELKVSLNVDSRQSETRYREVTDESELRRELDLPDSGLIEDVFIEHGILPFGTWTTKRHTYAKDGFTIDVDYVDYGSFQRSVTEIELVVPDESQAQEAADRIHAFASAHGFSPARIPGKVVSYLQRERPDHYEALITAGVFTA